MPPDSLADRHRPGQGWDLGSFLGPSQDTLTAAYKSKAFGKFLAEPSVEVIRHDVKSMVEKQ